HGGLYVVVPNDVAKGAGLRHGARVRGTANGAAYRSSLMKYSGVFHVGIHKVTAAAVHARQGDIVELTIEFDDQPLPTDLVPDDLAAALAEAPNALEAWLALAPARRREYVKSVVEAKKPETRGRRVANIAQTLRAGVPKRREWKPAK